MWWIKIIWISIPRMQHCYDVDLPFQCRTSWIWIILLENWIKLEKNQRQAYFQMAFQPAPILNLMLKIMLADYLARVRYSVWCRENQKGEIPKKILSMIQLISILPRYLLYRLFRIYQYFLVGARCSNSYGQDKGISKGIIVASRYSISLLSIAGAPPRKYTRTKRNSWFIYTVHGQWSWFLVQNLF